MVRHIVMWKVKDEAMGMQKAALTQAVKSRLEGLVAQISEIKSFQVGLNQGPPSERTRDIVLVSDFADWAALERYAAHPKHLEVVDFVKQAVDESRVVDFEA